MDFLEVLAQVRELLQAHGRVTYRVLKRQFELDDESLQDLKEQLIDAEELAIDKDDKMLVWTGDGEPFSSSQPPTLSPQSPASYTRRHRTKRIKISSLWGSSAEERYCI